VYRLSITWRTKKGKRGTSLWEAERRGPGANQRSESNVGIDPEFLRVDCFQKKKIWGGGRKEKRKKCGKGIGVGGFLLKRKKQQAGEGGNRMSENKRGKWQKEKSERLAGCRERGRP